MNILMHPLLDYTGQTAWGMRIGNLYPGGDHVYKIC